MEIAETTSSANQPIKIQDHEEPSRLKEACEEFEGMLMGIILKQGFKPGILDEKQQTGGELLQDYALEQTARALAGNGSFGIADMLYRQMAAAQPEGDE